MSENVHVTLVVSLIKQSSADVGTLIVFIACVDALVRFLKSLISREEVTN